MNPTYSKTQTEEGVVQDLAELLGARGHLLDRLKAVKLPEEDARLVVLAGRPIGVIRRNPYRMCSWYAKRSLPFSSIQNASLSLVGTLVEAAHTGGPDAVRVLLGQARKEAILLGARLQAIELEEAEV